MTNRYNILMRDDFPNTKAMVYRLELGKHNICTEATFCSPEIKELYNYIAYAMSVDYFDDAEIVSDATYAPRCREMTKEERKGLEHFLAYESEWNDWRWGKQ
ncbi:MAG: hypothetical protein WC852_00755 [Candidatus Nanoarchaeia archaeon]|jgi:hypothetical protein